MMTTTPFDDSDVDDDGNSVDDKKYSEITKTREALLQGKAIDDSVGDIDESDDGDDSDT